MSTSVIVKTAISGTIDGVPWPAVGESFTLDDTEAGHLAAAGHVEVVERSEPAKRETRGSTT